jgi:hypothetical protein
MSNLSRTSWCGACAAVLVSLANAQTPAAPAATASSAELPIYTEWKNYTVADGLPSAKVLTVLAVGDDVWAGTDSGLARLHEGRWETFTTKQGLAFEFVNSIACSAETGDLWIGTMGGLSRYSAGRIDSFTQLSSGLINDVVYYVMPVGRDVWAATASGLSVYHTDTKRWELYNHENSGMHEPWCYGLTTSPGKVWAAIWGSGVLERDLERGTWKVYRDPDGELEVDLVKDDGVLTDVISGVSYDQGLLWVSTYFGLSRYDGRSWRCWLHADSPLPSDFVNTLRAKHGWGWMATDAGLAASDGDRWVIYTSEEGRPGGTIRVHRGPGEPEVLHTAVGLAHNYVFGVDPGENRVCVATAGGVSIGYRTTKTAMAVEREETANGR